MAVRWHACGKRRRWDCRQWKRTVQRCALEDRVVRWILSKEEQAVVAVIGMWEPMERNWRGKREANS